MEQVPAVSFEDPSLRDYAISAGLWSLGLGWLVPVMGGLTGLYAALGPDRVDPLSRVYCDIQILLTFCKWRAVVHPEVDPKESYLFAQNHTNHFDHCMLYNATPHFKQGLELESHFKYPFYGWFMKVRGTIPVRPGREGQTPEIMDRMRMEIGKGHSILAFPEGTRTVDGRVGPFRKGVFFIARDLGIPIVPVSLTGTFELMRKGSYVLRPGHEITVYCDKPIPTAGVPDHEIGDLAEEVRRVIAGRIDDYWEERAKAREEG